MSGPRRSMPGLLALALLAGCGTPAHETRVDDLPAPAVEIAEPFSNIAGVVPLSDGRVLVADVLDGELTVVEFTGQTRTRLGRQGSGPGEYQMPAAAWVMAGDTVWVLDAPQQRVVAYGPDFAPGGSFPLMLFNQQRMTQLTAPFLADRGGRVYAGEMALQIGQAGVRLPDSAGLVRLTPRANGDPVELARFRFPTSGQPEMAPPQGGVIRFKSEWPGLVPADAWTVFPDGRVAIVRGADFTVEFIGPDDARAVHGPVAEDRYPVTEADKDAEMEEARRQLVEQTRAVQRMMPAGMRIEFDITPPAQWPATYPPVAALGAMAAPDGHLWIKRGAPVRLGRERWDVVDEGGAVVARWQLPPKTTIAGLGRGVVYTVRTDEDDLRYLQRVELPR